MADNDLTPPEPPKFDFDFEAFPPDAFFHDRRSGLSRRKPAEEAGPRPANRERRAKKDRRRKIDPTTFEKQYTPDEIEFMTAMQQFKVESGKAFPTFREVLKVAVSLGYRRVVKEDTA